MKRFLKGVGVLVIIGLAARSGKAVYDRREQIGSRARQLGAGIKERGQRIDVRRIATQISNLLPGSSR